MTAGRVVRLFTQEPGLPFTTRNLDLGAARASGPAVSCIMATRGHAFPARHAIACFLAQTHAERELVVACAETDSEVERLIATLGDPRIRFVAATGARTVGDIRNAAIAQADGALVCVWDDDDMSHPGRVAWQAMAMADADSGCCFLSQVMLWWPDRRRLAIGTPRIWENTMLVRREGLPPYPSLARGGDTVLADSIRNAGRICLIEQPTAYCYVAHGGNLWGDDHFAMLFANASQRHEGDDYAAAFAALSAAIPLREYERERAGDAADAP